MKTIGFIGLGAMGLPMAISLLRKGFRVTGFDLRAAALEELEKTQGRAASSAADCAKGADALILMVVNAAQAEDSLFARGALEALPETACVILMATCAPADVERIAGRVTATGRGFLDAPVSGGVVGARAAGLTIMVGAPKSTFDAAKPVLDALGEKIFHVGEKPGQGAMAKTVNQLLCGVHIAVAAEALSLAGKVGVDRAVMLEILGGSAASSWMLKDRGPRMLDPGPEVSSAVDIFVKDLGIVMAAGRDAKAALPFAALAHQLFLSVSGQGGGGADDSQIIRAFTALNGAAR